MKTLFVMRHAKSSWEYPDLSDFERPLNKRGKRSAPLVGRAMAERGYVPDVIISSPAERAVQTVALVAEAVGYSGEVVFDRAIYGAGLNGLSEVVSGITDNYSSALIAGHNPGFEQLVQSLVGRYTRMPTAALAVIDLDITGWSAVKSGCGTLRDYLIPKALK